MKKQILISALILALLVGGFVALQKDSPEPKVANMGRDIDGSTQSIRSDLKEYKQEKAKRQSQLMTSRKIANIEKRKFDREKQKERIKKMELERREFYRKFDTLPVLDTSEKILPDKGIRLKSKLIERGEGKPPLLIQQHFKMKDDNPTGDPVAGDVVQTEIAMIANQIILKVDDPNTLSQLQNQYGLRVLQNYRSGGVLVEFDVGSVDDLDNMMGKLKSIPGVEYAEPNFYGYLLR